MNILIVTAYPPVLHRHGGGVRMYHNIRVLAERHPVHVLSFVENDEEFASLDEVRPVCASIRGILRIPDFRPHWLSLAPFMVREFSTPEMHDAVDGMFRAKGIEVLQCEYLQMAQFHRKRVFSLLTAHEAQSKNTHEAFENASDPVEKLRLFYRWMQMLRYEIAQIRKFDRTIAMTAEDAEYFRSYAPEAQVRVIPIGIDPSEFKPATTADGALSVFFVGNYRHTPNLEAAQFLAQQLAPRFPEVRFVIGGSPAPQDLGNLEAGPNVEFPGYISETQGFYKSPDTIVVTPLFSGTGQRVKLLEAFATACPVITTRIGAMGFPIENGVQAMLADTLEDFDRALRRLIASRELRRAMGQRGRAMILDRFSWSRIGGEFLDVVEEAAVSH